LLKSLVLVLFVVAWAAVAFAIVRGLVVAWGFDRRVAVATAVAVAGAFVLGAMSPFVLGQFASTPAPTAAVAPPAPPAIANTVRSVHCPANARVGSAIALGNNDTITVGAGTGVGNAGVIAVPAGAIFHMGGWTALKSGPSGTICATVDGHPVEAVLTYSISRPDVAAALAQPSDVLSGFGAALRLPAGKHSVDVGAVEADGKTIELIRLPVTVQVQ
jgi:hypothetical protein